uniref:TFIIS N-terminal domain-containing protein n=1 Tax=Ananas comosus var. bracteatus TaxID=296719 RepID=A0A6V7PED5_ANACO|nr:unnamed protein product [Ananas comosus var. bracteatus]
MAGPPPPAQLEDWRELFRGGGGAAAESDIFEVIENAILVAAWDRPQELRIRRDRIVERLYTALLPRCFGCDRAELRSTSAVVAAAAASGGGGGDDAEEGGGSVRRNRRRGASSNYSYDEAEALTEEIEEESQIVGEVLRIKEILINKQDQSESVLFDSLRRLQLMELSVATLRATEIGRAVNGLRKHGSKQIRHLVRTLIEGWKVLVDEWVNATAAIADNSPESVNPSVVDEEEGLPSPPLDEGALLLTQTTSIQLSEFFDGMDDDGNFRNNSEYGNKRENGRKPPVNNEAVRKPQPPRQMVNPEKVARQVKRQEPVMRPTKPLEASSSQQRPQGHMIKPTKPLNTESGPGRPQKSTFEPKQSQILAADQRRSAIPPTDKPNYSEEASVRAKLELAKRKLHEGYQQAENAKKQRTIQVMELQDIPKQSNHNRQFNMKPKNHFRNWANGRH